MTWASTRWGVVCQAIADMFTDATDGYPQFTVGIGPDPEDLNEMGPRITFIALDSSFAEPRHGGGLETHPTFDEVIPTRVNIHVPGTIDGQTNYDTSPVLLDAAVNRFLESCDAIRHTPYLIPRAHARRGGKIGEAGSTSTMLIDIRVEYFRTPATMGIATAKTTTFGVEGPDGNSGTIVESFEVIGNEP